MRRKAQQARQVLKDFNFSTSDGFEAEARKVLNMSQQWAAAQDYTLQELGIQEWVQKAVVQAQKVLQLVTVLFGIEDRAKLYYISGGSSSGGGSKPTPTPDGGDTPTPEPEPEPEPTPVTPE